MGLNGGAFIVLGRGTVAWRRTRPNSRNVGVMRCITHRIGPDSVAQRKGFVPHSSCRDG